MADEPASSEARTRLAAAGIQPSEEELAFFDLMYPLLRTRADTVYAVQLDFEP